MLESLTERLARALKTIKGQARLTEANTQEMLREIRLAMLEADVALPVVKTFIQSVREKALGQDVLDSLTPGQMTNILLGPLGSIWHSSPPPSCSWQDYKERERPPAWARSPNGFGSATRKKS
jgi:hypothetical protein